MNFNWIVDKSQWTDGPWQHEPDYEEFEYKGFPCLILRMKRTGNLNGYVALDKSNKFYEKYYMDLAFEVHGGLTFSNLGIAGLFPEKWIIGFDCAHGDDLIPVTKSAIHLVIETFIEGVQEMPTYKDINFVRNEIKELVDQIIEAQKEK